jgi:hypothetical protein
VGNDPKRNKTKIMAGINLKKRRRSTREREKGFPLYVTDWLTSQSHVIRKEEEGVGLLLPPFFFSFFLLLPPKNSPVLLQLVVCRPVVVCSPTEFEIEKKKIL